MIRFTFLKDHSGWTPCMWQDWNQGDQLGGHCSDPGEGWWWPGLDGDNGVGENCPILEVFSAISVHRFSSQPIQALLQGRFSV